MKTEFVVAVVFALSTLAVGTEASDWQREYDTLLKKYVVDGGVRYAAWKADGADLAALRKVVAAIGATNTSALDRNDQIAFYINAYNAWILHEALDKYPTKSVKDPLFIFFISKRITVAGEKMSFKHLEDGIIRPRFHEPRIHFALNCASRSCPPLRAEAYDGARLDAQFEEQTRAFVNSDRGVKPSGETAQLSKIFDWYKDDFGGDAGIAAFLKKYRNGKSQFKSVSYQDYDWGLNETK
jgi:hypothetical protein